MDYTLEVKTALGIITIHGDDKGLTKISLPQQGKTSGNDDRRTYPLTAPPYLQQAAKQIAEYCEGKRNVFALPLRLHGTEFQRRVWEIIRSIPYGRTLSYGEIARQLGSRSKARAVGGAAHANPLPLVIPCHRVVGADGSLTGFAGGTGLKKKLLDLEATAEI